MAVTQISRIQIRRGPSDTLDNNLAEGEFGFTTDTGELFIGAPGVSQLANRSSFPYQNLRVLTELDVTHTLTDNIVTTGPISRVPFFARDPNQVDSFTFSYMGPPLILWDASDPETIVDPSLIGKAKDRVIRLDCQSACGNLRGRVISKVENVTASQTYLDDVARSIATVGQIIGPSTPDSFIMFDLDEANMATITSDVDIAVSFYPLNEIIRYDLNQCDSIVVQYSLEMEPVVPPADYIPVRRVGQLIVTADEYSVMILDTGIDMNQQFGSNFMRVVFSGHIDDNEMVLTCTNDTSHPVSMSFNGSRWKHTKD